MRIAIIRILVYTVTPSPGPARGEASNRVHYSFPLPLAYHCRPSLCVRTIMISLARSRPFGNAASLPLSFLSLSPWRLRFPLGNADPSRTSDPLSNSQRGVTCRATRVLLLLGFPIPSVQWIDIINACMLIKSRWAVRGTLHCEETKRLRSSANPRNDRPGVLAAHRGGVHVQGRMQVQR